MDDLEQRRHDLSTALAAYWEYELRDSPELATAIGDYRYNDRWSDLSLDHIEQRRRDTGAWLARFRAIDTTGFSEQELLNRDLMVRNLAEELEDIGFKSHEMPVDQLDGAHLVLAQFVNLVPLDELKHYEDYLARLRGVPLVIDQVIELLVQGEKDGLMPPRYLLEKTVVQCRNIAAPAGEGNALAVPAAKFLDSVPAAERARLRGELLAAIDQQVRPAYEKLAGFIEREYAPKGRTEFGIWSLPDGEARYRFLIHKLTTTDFDPDSIHELGLAEVARIEAEQTAIARKLGFAHLDAFRASLAAQPRLVPSSRAEIVDTFRRYVDQMKPKLPALFGLLPAAAVEVRPMEQYREKEAAGAEYFVGTPDGSRAGIVYVNTGDHEHRSLMTVEATAYHEALPGHHLQMSIAQTLPGLPAFRQHAHFGAYIEGWALYAEALGKELGFYQDPLSDFGRLSEELLRAVRLVLDTGVHHRRWSREQMVEYFRKHSFEDEPDIQAETDRYIVSPAQALSYKLGQLKILEVRERARKALGARFDIRAFHDEVLGGGALPLDVLDSRIAGWISAQMSPGEGER